MRLSHIFSTSLLVGLALASLASVASAASISCPTQQVRREVTTNLPNGWWNTPLISNLSDTRVIEIGGRKSLQCLYGPNGAGGAIQRYAPDNQICTATPGGFNCLPIILDLNPVHSQGILSVPQTYLFDLDQSAVRQPGADVWFQAETHDRLYLVPRNGAKIGVLAGSAGTYNRCRNARKSTARLSMWDLPVGTKVCYQTSEGRIGVFRITGLSAHSPKTLKIRHTTWR
jgi:hypothetical protein